MGEFRGKYGPWAIVTGASSGIGMEFSRQLAALKINLVLVSRRKDRLDQLSEELIACHDIETKVVAVDLSEIDFIDPIKEVTDGLEIGLLVNNAGFALTGEFLEHDFNDELRMLHVNCRAPLMLAHTFGKQMVQRGKGGIINVASISAFLPLPYWSHYAATKAYVLSFSEGLGFEIKDKGVDVLALCPGSTRTEFAKVSSTKKSGMDASAVVEQAINSIGKKSQIITGFNNRLITIMNGLMPRKLRIKLGASFVKGMAIEN